MHTTAWQEEGEASLFSLNHTIQKLYLSAPFCLMFEAGILQDAIALSLLNKTENSIFMPMLPAQPLSCQCYLLRRPAHGRE